jgi:hypothetical protein
MMRRLIGIGSLVVVLGLSWMAVRSQGAERVRRAEGSRDRAVMREAIRNTPLLERPNRPGHFYGNTVRRVNQRRSESR